ncbi:hypothetical protein [Pedobacter frigoris]|uniref:hypothetical protein n=1 Tax=Pedobacter frigoris TaxID=2571272 RepID=UPI002931A7A6|nr:hypothetical protein [Pedobacter frigoris]
MAADQNKSNGAMKANDKLHPMNLGETKDFDNLSYDKDKNSFEFDVKNGDSDYDHPLPYDTSAPNGEDSISSYDEANPYIGSEYDDEKQRDENLENSGMRIEDENILEVSPEDEMLARTDEDNRDDLDEEGYPVNDRPKKF